MSGFRKGFLNKPNNVSKTNQKNIVTNPMENKKDEQEFERISRLAIDKFFREYIVMARKEGQRIDYQQSRRYFSGSILRNENFSQIIKGTFENLTYEVLFDKLFNECALEILDEEEGFEIQMDEAILGSRRDFELLCFQVVTESVERVMDNLRVFDRDTKSKIREELNRHNKFELVRAELVKNEKNGFILENLISKCIWKVYDKDSFMTKEDFATLCEKVIKECVNDATENLQLMMMVMKDTDLDAGRISESLKQVLKSHKDRPKLLKATNRYPEYCDIQEEIFRKHIRPMMAILHKRKKEEEISKEEFERLSAEVLEELERVIIENQERIKNGTISVEEFNSIAKKTVSRHRSYPKLAEAFNSNKSYEQQFGAKFMKIGTQLCKDILEKSENREDFESLCHRVFEECCNQAFEIVKDCDAETFNIHHFQYLMNLQLEKHNEHSRISIMENGNEKNESLFLSLMTDHAVLMMKEHMAKRNLIRELENWNNEKNVPRLSKNKKGSVTKKSQKNISKEEFTRDATEVFEKIKKESNKHEEQLREGMLTVQEVNELNEKVMCRHKLYKKIKEAMNIDESYRHMYQLISLRNASKIIRKSNRNKISESSNEMELLCHRVFEECYNRVLEKINNVNDRTKLNIKYYENWLTREIYMHKDICQFMKIMKKCLGKGAQGDVNNWKFSENLVIFDSLIMEYSNKLMDDHKKKCESNQTNPENKNNEQIVPKKLPKEEEKDEISEKDQQLIQKTTENNCEKGSKHDESNQESMKNDEELENQPNVEEENSEIKLKSDEEIEEAAKKTMNESLKLEKENLGIEKKENYEKSTEWYKNKLEKSEKLVEILQQKRENDEKEHDEMASKIAEMKEFQRINNKETEEWKAQIMKLVEKQAEDLKMAKQELKKYEARK